MEIERVDVFRLVLNKQNIEKLKAIFITKQKIITHASTVCFTLWKDHQGDLI